MKCEHVSYLISRYVDGDLPPDKAEAFRDHIAGCAACRMDMAAERTSVKALAAPIRVFDAPDVLAQVKRRATEPRRQLVRPVWQWAAAGLAAACCLFSFGTALMRKDTPPEMAANPVTVQEAAPAPNNPVPPAVKPAVPKPSAAPPVTTTEPHKPAAPAKRIIARNKPLPRKPDLRRAPSPAPVLEHVAQKPEIDYLVVYNHSGLGDGMGTPDANAGSAGSETSEASAYSISMTDESTGAVTNVSVYTNPSGESRESATVEFRSESVAPDVDERERSSTDEKSLHFAGGAAHDDLC